MQLQKEIQASRFESVHQQAVVNVVYTANWCNDQLRQALLPYNVTTQQFNVLRILRGQHPEPCTISLLKARILDKMCDASRIVDRLKQKDFVAKSTSKSDKRAADIIITEKGLALLKEMDQNVDLSFPVSNNLTSEETELLNTLLDKMRG